MVRTKGVSPEPQAILSLLPPLNNSERGSCTLGRCSQEGGSSLLITQLKDTVSYWEEMATSVSHPLQLRPAESKFLASIAKRLLLPSRNPLLIRERSYLGHCSRILKPQSPCHSLLLKWRFHAGRNTLKRRKAILPLPSTSLIRHGHHPLPSSGAVAQRFLPRSKADYKNRELWNSSQRNWLFETECRDV